MIVSFNKYQVRKKRGCHVSDWFQDDKHNHDYVRKVVKYNKCNITISMPKEEVLYRFSAKNVKIQLVRMSNKYQIRKNRRVLKNCSTLVGARMSYIYYVDECIRQLYLFDYGD